MANTVNLCPLCGRYAHPGNCPSGDIFGPPQNNLSAMQERIERMERQNALLVKELENISETGRTLVSKATGVVCALIADRALAAVKEKK